MAGGGAFAHSTRRLTWAEGRARRTEHRDGALGGDRLPGDAQQPRRTAEHARLGVALHGRRRRPRLRRPDLLHGQLPGPPERPGGRAYSPSGVVRLTRIYTRLGDDGDTHLGDMSRARKTSPRVVAYGDVDELNAAIGVARTQALAPVADGVARGGPERPLRPRRRPVRAARRRRARAPARRAPRRSSASSAGATRSTTTCRTSPASSCPAAAPGAAALHHARTVCRRAERSTVALADREPITPEALAYLNRLSDLLFILARAENRDAGGDVLWCPGRVARRRRGPLRRRPLRDREPHGRRALSTTRRASGSAAARRTSISRSGDCIGQEGPCSVI